MLADEIEEIVNKILEHKKLNKSLDEFENFKKENKLLYETVVGDDYNPVIFKEMMKMKRLLESGRDQYSVDVRFGKFMAEKFIDPVINK
jgi:hypothetical protein